MSELFVQGLENISSKNELRRSSKFESRSFHERRKKCFNDWTTQLSYNLEVLFNSIILGTCLRFITICPGKSCFGSTCVRNLSSKRMGKIRKLVLAVKSYNT
jgi:hypothetical protein